MNRDLNPQGSYRNIYNTIYGLFLTCILSWAVIALY